MRLASIVIAGILVLVGAVWFLQGIGILQGSVMTGQSFWMVVGVAAFVVGLALMYFGLRSRQPASRA